MRLAIAVALLLAGSVVEAQLPVAKSFAPPSLSGWTPNGCRAAPAEVPALPGHLQWSNLHGDSIASDSISGVLAPVFGPTWTAEAATYNPTGPVFDRAGNLYLAPLVPYENVVLLSLDPGDGHRRWAVAGSGAASTGSAPMVLVDPDNPSAEIIYLVLYDRAIAVRTDGSIVWDVPSGLTLHLDPMENLVLGTNYVPTRDAIAGLTGDGYVVLFDRRTGAALLSPPYQLPGVASPAVASVLPPALLAAADTDFRAFVNLPVGSLQRFTQGLLGNGVEVANMFSVEPRSGRLWVAATAPDGEDGTVDGVSQLGALYGLDVVATPGGLQIAEACHRSFTGGSASTPTLSADGTRVYVGDNFGALIAVEADCQDAWSLNVGAQIFGSVSVPADKREVYASTQQGIVKVVDAGASGTLLWSANLDVFDLAPGQSNLNMNLVATAENGLAFQAGAGVVLNGTALPSIVGTGILDRDTGQVRWFVGGGEETVAVMSAGPDGALYIGNSPLRRIFARRLGLSSAPLSGGVTKFAPQRLDLLMRDAVCAGEARARNAAAQTGCPDAVRADALQIGDLITQTRAVAPQALSDGDVGQVQWNRLARRLSRAEPYLARAAAAPSDPRPLTGAARRLGRVCRKLSE